MPHVAFHTFHVPDNSNPAFSTPVTWCRYFQSCIFHPCSLVPIIPVMHFPVSHFQRPRINNMASILAFWSLRRLRQLHPLRSLRYLRTCLRRPTFLASSASLASKSTQRTYATCVALDGNRSLIQLPIDPPT